MPPPAELIALACTIAQRHVLDPALVCAIIEQESAWDAHAIRYEPAFRTRYVAPLGLPPTEEIARSISWGLMQVMGQVAREHSFGSKFLAALCDPAAGIEVGCAVLASKLAGSRTAGVSPANLNLPLPLQLPSPLPSSLPTPSPLPSVHVAAAFRPAACLSDEALTARALQLWNGGGNPNYASEVLARLSNYK
jgi:Transglycosylase SLT domain